MSKQEICHPIMSLPTVSCSHSFMNINLANNSRKLLVPLEAAGGVEEDATNNGVAATTSVTKMTIIDAYSCRMDEDK